MNTKIDILHKENGFTLPEIIIACLILSLISMPIFHGCFQSSRNFILAEKYYKLTLDSQNILVNIKNCLDELCIDNLDTNINSHLKKILDNLNLDIKNYNYELYFKEINKDSTFAYSYPSGTDCIDNDLDISFRANENFIFYDSFPKDLVYLESEELIINNKKSKLTSPINLNQQPTDINIKNYQPQDIELNIYSDETVKYIDNLKVQSYPEGGSVRINYYKGLISQNKNYIIIVSIKEVNTNNILIQLCDIYSSVY